MGFEKIKIAVVKMLVEPKNVILKVLKSSEEKRRKKKMFLKGKKMPKLKK